MDRRINKEQLKKILTHIFENGLGKGQPLLQASPEEKEAAIEAVANDIMESRNGKPFDPEELNKTLLLELAVSLMTTVTQDKVAPDFKLTKEDMELIKNFKDPEFKPTPEQQKRYQEIEEAFKEICKEVIKVFKLEDKQPEKLAEEMADDILNSFRNLEGRISPDSSIRFPLATAVFGRLVPKTGITYETSMANIDQDSRMSDTQNSAVNNIITGLRLVQMGDSDVYNELKNEGVFSNIPTLTRH